MKAKLISLLLVTAVAAMVLCGCASIVSRSDYAVSFRSTPSGATVWVTDESGEPVYSGKTPATVTLQAGAGYFKGSKYTAKFSMPGYQDTIVPVMRKLDGWYIFGNFFIGGLIGYLIVDPLTGAMWKLEDRVHASMSKQTSQTGARQLRIVTLDQVPMDKRARLVRIEGCTLRPIDAGSPDSAIGSGI